MLSEMGFCFYSFCVLTGFLAFLQQTEGNVGRTGLTTGKTYFFYQHPTYPRDCKEVLHQCSGKNSSGVYVIKPDGFPYPFEVYCDNSLDSWGWTVFMRRLDGSLLFTRNWINYKEGFGFLSSEFFLGNEKLAYLTNQQRYQLRIDITISNGSTGFMKYSYFRISDEWGNYSLASLGEAEITSDIIPVSCPSNMIYTNCSCEKTCEAPTSCQNNCQEEERCTCPDGFVLKGSDCVTHEECQCFHTAANKVIPKSGSVVNDQCSTQCTCSESGLTCSSYSCHADARCISSSEGGRCVCNTGFIGDGRDCRPLCPTNMIYTNCTCERTCEAPSNCQNNCQETSRCVCPNGFFLRGSDCVHLEECPCYSSVAGEVILVGESYINSQCSQRCSCSSNGLTCANYACDQNARCTRTADGGRCSCNTGFVGNGETCGCNRGYLVDGSGCRRPMDCDEVPSTEGYSGSGLYYILPSNWQEFRVYCNISEGRWTVLQRRIPDSTQNFYLSWSSYKRGFGELDEDFWLGNDKIHHLTSQRNYQLRIDIIDSGNRHYRAVYNGFRIGNEDNKYRMTVLGSYSGNAGYDAMRHHFNQPFSTSGTDNDGGDGVRKYGYYNYCYYYYYNCDTYYGGNCAAVHGGAWWYKHRGESSSSPCDHYTYTDSNYYEDRNCQNRLSVTYSCAFSNLNGKQSGSKGQTIFWHGLSGNDCGIKYTEMKVRPL